MDEPTGSRPERDNKDLRRKLAEGLDGWLNLELWEVCEEPDGRDCCKTSVCKRG